MDEKNFQIPDEEFNNEIKKKGRNTFYLHFFNPRKIILCKSKGEFVVIKMSTTNTVIGARDSFGIDLA